MEVFIKFLGILLFCVPLISFGKFSQLGKGTVKCNQLVGTEQAEKYKDFRFHFDVPNRKLLLERKVVSPDGTLVDANVNFKMDGINEFTHECNLRPQCSTCNNSLTKMKFYFTGDFLKGPFDILLKYYDKGMPIFVERYLSCKKN